MGEDLPEEPLKRNPGGRPKALLPDEATLKMVRGLGRIMATVEESAAFFGVAKSTFELFLNEPGVRDVFLEGQGLGKIGLRRRQFQMARKSVAMAIFLGKNYLHQSDRVADENPDAPGEHSRVIVEGGLPEE